MTSLLMEILESSEKMEADILKTKQVEIESVLETTKSDVLKCIENAYVRFNDRPRQNKILGNKIQQLENDISDLLTNIEAGPKLDLESAENSVSKNKLLLEELNLQINLVSTVWHIHQALIAIDNARNCDKNIYCMEEIMKTEKFILELREEESLPAIEKMKVDLSIIKQDFIEICKKRFRENIILSADSNSSVIKIVEDNSILEDILKPLYISMENIIEHLRNFATFLINNIISLIIDYTVNVRVSSQDDFVILEVVTVHKTKSTCKEVFNTLKIVFELLSKQFDIELEENVSIIHIIGELIYTDLLNKLITDCLEDTIPENDESLRQYPDIIGVTEDFEDTLKSLKIIPEDNITLTEFVYKVEELYFARKCEGYKKLAQNIMRKDLHNLTEVGDNDSSLETTQFPHCSISKNVIELLSYLEKVLKEAFTLPDSASEHLIFCVNTICLDYITFVPSHHKKFLETIPQQIALYYNNCKYIEYQIMEWEKQFSELKPFSDSFHSTCFNLRETAITTFDSYVQTQINQIKETLRESWCQELSLQEVSRSCENSVRQCLRQQELLRTVWQKVLSSDFYNKTLGNILDSFAKGMIDGILVFEDISTNAAEELVELLTIAQNRGPKLFTDPREVNLFVPNWYKLTQLVFVLNSNLIDIEDGWTEGKGPLAMQFKSEELKKLIKALFQNTENRAKLLSKIKD